MSSLISSVEVDFSASEVEKVRRLGVVPQFFRGDAAPLLAANQYMRARSRSLSEKSLRTEAEHIKEMLSWMLSTGMEIADIDEDSFDSYVEALCLYQKSNGDSLSWNTINARVAGAYRFLAWASTNRFCPDLQQNEARDVADSAKGRYKSRNHLSRPISEPVKFLLMEDALKFISALGEVSGRNTPRVKHRNILVGAFMLQGFYPVSTDGFKKAVNLRS